MTQKTSFFEGNKTGVWSNAFIVVKMNEVINQYLSNAKGCRFKKTDTFIGTCKTAAISTCLDLFQQDGFPVWLSLCFRYSSKRLGYHFT